LETRSKVLELHDRGWDVLAIAKELYVSKRTVYRHLADR
jgi:DNA-binding NarL/FixJ family response regulator